MSLLNHARAPLAVLSFLSLFVISLTFVKPNWVEPETSRSTLAISASGIGNPHVNFEDGSFLETRRVGDRALVAAVESGLARPTAVTVADFDNDGVKDLVTAYSRKGTRSAGNGENAWKAGKFRGEGIVGIRRGNIDARHPNLEAARQRKAAGTFTDAPFFSTETLIAVDGEPDFIESGDFDADGNVDLALATAGARFVTVMTGRGNGRFRPVTTIDLEAGVTAMASDDVNRRDGLPELLVGTSGFSGSHFVIFESPEGALYARPEVFTMNAPVVGIATGQFDDDYAIDIAVAAGSEIHIISGRDRRLSLAPEDRGPVYAANVEVISLADNVRAIATGRFTDEPLQDLAVVSDAGHLGILDGRTRIVESTGYRFEDAVDLAGSKVAARPGSDLVVLEKDAVHILHRDHFQPRIRIPEVSPIRIEPVSFKTSIEGVALYSDRLNWDGLRDIAIIGTADGAAEVAIVNSAPLTTFNVDDNSTERDESGSDGICRTASGTCTLRAASMQIRQGGGPFAITFSVTDIQTAPNETIWTFTETVTIDGESFGSRVAILGFLGSLKFDARTSGNIVKGISVASVTAWDFFTIVNTYVGVSADGDSLLEGSSGLFIAGDANDIGGANLTERNVLSRLKFSGANDAVVFNNYVGTNAEGTRGIGSRGPGVDIGGSSSAIVLGGILKGEGNLISGMDGTANTGMGVRVSFSENVHIRGNKIGTDASGFFALGNAGDGIQAGGSTLILGNTIAANGENGVRATNRNGLTLTIQGNLIGTDATGEVALPNAKAGIKISSDSRVIVGGVTVGAGNVISGNGTHGIETRGFSSNDQKHIIQGNQIGTTRSGTPLPNQEHGIRLANDAGSLIGGSDPLGANTIAYNLQHGITFGSNSAVGNTISRNSIYSNGMLGIGMQHSADKPLKNDPGDVDTGPNNKQNYPELSVNIDGSVGVTFNSMPSQTFTLEFFGSGECDDSEFGQGKSYLLSEDATTDANGDDAFDIQISALPGQQFIAATATDSAGNTSEFSNCVEVDTVPALFVLVMQDSLNHAPIPVANTLFQIAHVDLSDAREPFEFVERQATDAKGMLILNPEKFSVGEPYFITTSPHAEPSSKAGHGDVGDVMYRVHVDNMFITNAGALQPDTLEADTTVTYLGHSSLAFNFVISIEWPTSDGYIESLKQAFRSGNNYLYDVANGQAFLGKVAIYDNMTHWDDADLRIYASNTQWPRAGLNGINTEDERMHFPPKHFGFDVPANVDLTFLGHPLDLDSYRTFSTFIHEFGHYAFAFFDEYEDSDGNPLPDDVNYGFMDKQMRGGDAISSEMSAFESPGYRQTRSFGALDDTNWEFFRKRYRKTFGNVRVEIHTPKRLGLNPGQMVAGPNDDLSQPDFDVGAQMEFVTKTSSITESAETISYLVTDEGGESVAGALVEIEDPESLETIQQGKSVIGIAQLGSVADKGRIRIRGGKDNDWVNFIATGGSGAWQTAIARVSVTGKITDDIVVTLAPIAGEFRMLSGVKFDDVGQLIYETESTTAFSSAPRVTASAGPGGDPVSVDLVANALIYTGELTNVTTSANLKFKAPDGDGVEFFVPQQLSVLAAAPGAQLNPVNDNIELFVDSTSDGIGRIAVLSSRFPPPTDGLADDLVQASPVYSIGTDPSGADFDAEIKIYFDADSLLASVPEAVKIYHWSGGQWEALETVVSKEQELQSALASIAEEGLYAAYLDETMSTKVAVEPRVLPDGLSGPYLLANYPNPFATTTRIPLSIESPSHVSMTVYNVLGQEVGRLAPQLMQAGEHELIFDAEQVPPGTYVYVVDLDGRRETGVMLVAR